MKLIYILTIVTALFGTVSAQAPAQDAWRTVASPVVISQPIVFENAGATLHGTLYIPQSTNPVPAVVALHDASIGTASAALYRHLREGLPAIGIAVLLFDRRGNGSSSGNAQSVSYETLADDAIAGARAIAKLPQIDPARVGYWGLSQGGWLAAFASKRDPKAAFVISVSAPLVTPASQMEFAMSNRLLLLGYTSQDVAQMLTARRALDDYANGSVTRTAAASALAKIEGKPWFSLMYLPASSQLPQDRSSLAERMHNMTIDPLTSIEDIHVPALFIFGGSDPWIPVKASISRLRNLAKTHPNIQYEVVANASHEMMLVSKPSMATDPQALSTYAPDAPAYFTLLSSWLTRNARLDSALLRSGS